MLRAECDESGVTRYASLKSMMQLHFRGAWARWKSNGCRMANVSSMLRRFVNLAHGFVHVLPFALALEGGERVSEGFVVLRFAA